MACTPVYDLAKNGKGILVCLTALRFSSGPCHNRNTHQYGTTSASRKIDAKPRLAPAKTFQLS